MPGKNDFFRANLKEANARVGVLSTAGHQLLKTLMTSISFQWQQETCCCFRESGTSLIPACSGLPAGNTAVVSVSPRFCETV